MLTNFSNQIADVVAQAAASVVQVRAHRGAASGIVHSDNLVLTTGRVVGRDEHPEVRTADGRILPAELVGWDPATRLALLRVSDLAAPSLSTATLPRVGEIAIAVGRSLSNNITATIGIVSVVGGPLRTGPRRQIDHVIRTSAPMHDGFAGGALVGTDGRLLGVATAAAIRGLGVVIPAQIASASAAAIQERGSARRGYLGIAAQGVGVPEKQRQDARQERALLVVGVKPGSPAEAAGVLVGDLLVALDGVALATPEDLLDLLVGDRVGRAVTAQVVRGGRPEAITITAAER